MRFSAERYHYPVGQGIFSAQIIRADGEGYVCVYDCGSSTYKNEMKNNPGANKFSRWVKELRQRTNGVINLLVISHLDEDHFNGMSELLREFKIEKIVIPYMSKIEKIIFALSCPYDIQGSGGLDDWSPRNFFAGVLAGSLGDDFGILNSLEGVEIVESTEESPIEYFNLNSNVLEGGDEPFLVWEFYHFSLFSGIGESIKNEYIEGFRNAFYKVFHKDIEDISMQDLNNDLKDFKEIYRDTCENVKKKYSRIGIKDIFNASSVILYSGPARDILKYSRRFINRLSMGRQVVDRYGITNACHKEDFHYCSKSDDFEHMGGWLGTGDARLKDAANILELRNNLGQSRIERIRVITVPHHGSKNNSDYEFYSIFSRPRVECVVHSDPKRGYRHPHVQTKEVIARSGFIEIPVTKEDDSFYAEYLSNDYQSFCCFRGGVWCRCDFFR